MLFELTLVYLHQLNDKEMEKENYKQLEELIVKFFNENQAISYANIAHKVGSRTNTKQHGIPKKYLFDMVKQIAKYGFAIGKYEFWTIENETEIKKLYAINMNDFITIEGIEYHEIESLEDVFKLMNK